MNQGEEDAMEDEEKQEVLQHPATLKPQPATPLTPLNSEA
jgi:hypothetical protein